jgi:hypothetical protein
MDTDRRSGCRIAIPPKRAMRENSKPASRIWRAMSPTPTKRARIFSRCGSSSGSKAPLPWRPASKPSRRRQSPPSDAPWSVVSPRSSRGRRGGYPHRGRHGSPQNRHQRLQGHSPDRQRLTSLKIALGNHLARAFCLASPCARSRARHQLTLAALTPNRSPTPRCVIPAATAAKTRTRRSSESASTCPPASVRADRLNHLQRNSGIPINSDRVLL